MTTWETRIIGHGFEDPEQLLANPRNWRVHPREQEDAIAQVLDRVGWVRGVLVNQRSGFVVDGHLRVKAAMKAGATQIPVEYVDLDDDEEQIILASIDSTTGMAGTDKDLLRELLEEIHTRESDLRGLVESIAKAERVSLEVYLADKGGEVRESERGELREKWKVETGQVWKIGPHRLMCGDSTNGEDVERLLEGAKPYLMVTDPPYGVEYNPEWRAEAAEKGLLDYAPTRTGEVKADDRIDWSPAWDVSPASVAYVWHAGKYASIVEASLEVSGYEVRSQIIWSKPHYPISRGHYHWRHEPCWYAVRKGRPAHWRGDRTQTTIWDVPLDPNEAGGHSTQKPLELMLRPIRNHEGDVYDPFLGTGTTMAAAHLLERTCYGMDVDPEYVAVALERMESLGYHPELAEP